MRLADPEKRVAASCFDSFARVHVSHKLIHVDEARAVSINISEQFIDLVVLHLGVASLNNELLELAMIQLTPAKTNGALPGCKLLKQLSQVLHGVI